MGCFLDFAIASDALALNICTLKRTHKRVVCFRISCRQEADERQREDRDELAQKSAWFQGAHLEVHAAAQVPLLAAILCDSRKKTLPPQVGD
eukprot:2309309-Amphidinium_carterae.1